MATKGDTILEDASCEILNSLEKAKFGMRDTQNLKQPFLSPDSVVITDLCSSESALFFYHGVLAL